MGLGRAVASFRSKLHWRLHRMFVDQWHCSRPFTKSGARRLLLISSERRIARSQTHLFFRFRRQIEQTFGLQIRELSVQAFEQGAPRWNPAADTVVVQPWLDVTGQRLQQLLEMVHERCSPTRVVYLDSFAPTDLRLGQCVDPYVDFYVKKHVLRDRSLYGKPTKGDTNLMDYFGQRFGIDHEVVCHSVSEALLSKLLVGPSFATADFMLRAFESNCSPAPPQKDIDVHARIETVGTD
ncbi:MAG: hypothetical protein ACI89X_001055, partial [Planctomycetota bacterium]